MSFGGYFSSGYTRRPEGKIGYLLTIYGASFILWSIYAAVFSRLDALVLVTLFLSFMLVLVFSTIAASSEPPPTGESSVPAYDWIFVIASIACGFYFAVNFNFFSVEISKYFWRWHGSSER